MNSSARQAAAETPATRVAARRSRTAIVGWAFLVWLASVVAYGLLTVLAENFVRRHTWAELLVLDSTLVLGSFLLLNRDRISWSDAGICLPMRPISWTVNMVVLGGIQLFGSIILFVLKAPDSFFSSLSLGQRLLYLCAAAPISEEMFVRGWLQTAYLRAIVPAKPTSAVLASALFFAGMHLFVSTSLLRVVVTVFAAFLSGLVYARVRQASGSLLPAVVMHSVFNASGWLMAKPLWILVSKIRG